jgi:hypothetical protein
MREANEVDNFNMEILESMDWGTNKGDRTINKVKNKPSAFHPDLKFSPLSPRQIKERTFLNRLKVQEEARRSQMKQMQWT